jgi:hypothetical protein
MTEIHCSRRRAKLLVTAGAQVNVLTQHNDLDRAGANRQETTLKPANVYVKHFGQLFKHVVDDQVSGQPLITGVEINGGTHDVVYITTMNNSVYAFDANEGSSLAFWHVNFGALAGLSDGNFGCTDMTGDMGIVGTPVIDVERKALHVMALTKTYSGFIQRLHALYRYVVTAVSSNGESAPSEPINVVVSRGRTPAVMH